MVSAERSLWLTPKDLQGNYIEDAYVGKNADPWLRKSYVLGADPFLLEISNQSRGKGKKDKTAKNVHLVVAINDPSKLVKIVVGGQEFLRQDFEDEDVYGTPKLASGRRMPKHGIFPTWFLEVAVGNIAQYEAVDLEIWVYGEEGLMVHFDAYGKGRPKKCKGKKHHKYCDWKSHHKYCKDKSHHKHYKGKWHHKYYKWKHHHKYCHSHKTCFRDVFNPFSHDVTVVIEEAIPLPVCELSQFLIELSPATINLSIPDEILSGSFAISVSAPDECSSEELDLSLSADLPVFLLEGEFERPVFTTVTAEQNGQISGNTISWGSLVLPGTFQFEAQLNVSVTTNVYSIEVQLEDSVSGETVSADPIEVDITGGGVPVPQ